MRYILWVQTEERETKKQTEIKSTEKAEVGDTGADSRERHKSRPRSDTLERKDVRDTEADKRRN